MPDAFHSVSVSVFCRYLDFAVSMGGDRTALIQQAGFDQDLPSGPDDRVGFRYYRNLVQASVKATDDPSLPLRYPFETALETASIVGLIIQSAENLGDAFHQLNRFARLMMEIDIMDGQDRHPVEINGEEAWILDARPDPNNFPELTEISLGRIIGEIHAVFPSQPFAEHITVTHPKPLHGDLYEALWKCPVEFSAPRNAIRFQRSWLDVKFDRANAYAFNVFSDRANDLKAQLEQKHDLRSQIETQLVADLHRGTSDIDQVARRLGMSRSTLYRHLKEEGVTFAQILDELRRRISMDYLSSGKASIKETAFLVGFSEVSSFNRAFKRWTGMTPKKFLSSR
ncbi:MAG: AraC family transcriptional regulator [Parvularcula sp.]